MRSVLFTWLIILAAYTSLCSQNPGVDSLRQIAVEHPADTIGINVLIRMANKFAEDNSGLDSAILFAREAYELADQIDYAPGRAEAAYTEAYAHDLAGHLSLALEYYEKARQQYETIDNVEQVAVCMNGKGVACYFQGEYGKALQYYLECLDYANAHNLKFQAANTQLNIGVIYRLTDKYDEAINIYQENVRIRKDLMDSTNLALVYNNLAVVYTYLKQFDRAIEYLDTSITIYQQLQDSFKLGALYVTLGDTYRSQGKSDLAMSNLKKGYDIMQKFNDNIHQSKALLYMGQTQFQSDNFVQAEVFYKEALKVLEESELDDIRLDIYKALASNNEAQGKYQPAYEYLSQYLLIFEKLQSEEKLRATEEMQTKYETAKKEQELISLASEKALIDIQLSAAQRRNLFLGTGLLIFGILSFIIYRFYKKVQSQNQVISENLKEKEYLLEELKKAQEQMVRSEKMASIGQLTAGIAHEINNPVNFIKNNAQALQLDIQDLQRLTDAIIKNDIAGNKNELIEKIKHEIDLETIHGEVGALVNGVQNGVDRISTIVRSLRHLTYMDQGQRVVTSLHEALDSAAEVIMTNYLDRISLEKNYQAPDQITAFPSQLHQLFLNLLNNAAQAIDEKGIIIIKTTDDPEGVKIQISDNGVGMNEETRTKIFDPFYTTKKIGEGTGLGLSISHAIIQNHDGGIDVESEVGKGTRITVMLPKGEG
ncbi:MAG: tetratricopeptide repeat-containing sensor histidine kinase [Saprospiraceae bacterium]|nr:tetratricopeptide repeat-containing sensor histidine kinase [Saprospiraceae bacterium]